MGLEILLVIAVTQLVKVLLIDRIEQLEGARDFALVIVAVLVAIGLSRLNVEALPTGLMEGVLATGMFSGVKETIKAMGTR